MSSEYFILPFIFNVENCEDDTMNNSDTLMNFPVFFSVSFSSFSSYLLPDVFLSQSNGNFREHIKFVEKK